MRTTTTSVGVIDDVIPVTNPQQVNVPVTVPEEVAGISAVVTPDEPCTVKATIQNGTLGFARDSHAISPAGALLLHEFTRRVLNQTNGLRFIELFGFASSEGSDEHNQRLSQDRAGAVKMVLAGLPELSSARIVAVGKGESGPIADNGTEDGRRQNRRVEILFHFSGCS